MRGSKTGLEVRIRNEKNPGLLDIDRDICHHIHNASKKFCSSFGEHVENLFDDVFNDHRWSPDLHEFFNEICEIIGQAPTAPERFVRHRWLSCYDLSISMLRVFDAYWLFYYAFLSSAEKTSYRDILDEIIGRYNISSHDMTVVKKIWADLKAKQKTLTPEGRKRKDRIVDKIIYKEKETRLTLNFYVAVLPLLKEYVLLFQNRRPLVHRLHERQENLMRNFLSCFMKAENTKVSSAQLLNPSLISEESMLNRKDLFIGKARKIVETMSANDILITEFYKKVEQAYYQCALYLQKKLPLNNDLLRAASSLDPSLQHNVKLSLLKKLKAHVRHFLSEEEQSSYDLEVHHFMVDMSLPSFDEEKEDPDRIDKWWACVKRRNQYPSLCKVALTLCTVFHGPLVSVALFLLCVHFFICRKNSLGLEL